MPISEIPLFSMLRTRMHWAQERQRLLAENVANADTPSFRPKDLSPPTFNSRVARTETPPLARTSSAHIAATIPAGGRFDLDRNTGAEVRPTGNAVSLEDEMMKVAQNQMDYQAATALYARSLGILKTAIGRK